MTKTMKMAAPRALTTREELRQYLVDLEGVWAEHASAQDELEARAIAARAVEMERRMLEAAG